MSGNEPVVASIADFFCHEAKDRKAFADLSLVTGESMPALIKPKEG